MKSTYNVTSALYCLSIGYTFRLIDNADIKLSGCTYRLYRSFPPPLFTRVSRTPVVLLLLPVLLLVSLAALLLPPSRYLPTMMSWLVLLQVSLAPLHLPPSRCLPLTTPWPSSAPPAPSPSELSTTMS